MRVEIKHKVNPFQVLEKLKKSLQKRILKRAIKAGVKPIKEAIKANVPVRSRALQSAISIKFSQKKGGFRVTGIVGPRRGFQKTYQKKTVIPTQYAHFVEAGSKRQKAYHVFSNIFEARKQEALETMRKVVEEGVTKELAKNGHK